MADAERGEQPETFKSRLPEYTETYGAAGSDEDRGRERFLRSRSTGARGLLDRYSRATDLGLQTEHR